MQKIVEMILKRNNHLQVKNVSINYAPQKKYIKNFAPKFKTQNIDFYASNATKIIVIIHFANFANKYIQIQDGPKTMINGLDVTNAIDG
jgi:hypothetical protein